MIPFNPEPVEVLRSKVPIALSKIWIADDTMIDRPGLHAEHIFDFQNKLRLIISKDKFPSLSSPVIHISASRMEMNNPVNVIAVYKALELIGLKGTLNFIGISPQGISHWLLAFTH